MTVALTFLVLSAGLAAYQVGKTFTTAFWQSEDWDRYAVLYLVVSALLYAGTVSAFFWAVREWFPLFR